MANAGSPLMLIVDVSRVIARASIASEQLRYLKVGNAATLTGPDGKHYPGKVTVVSPAMDPNSTTAEVWVTADNRSSQLRPGETVHVSIVAETIDSAILVPSAAIVPHEHRVRIGVRHSDVAQILEGINPGDKVIIGGALGLEDKAKVRVETPGKKE
jgi:multidrug efflux pump subunit AcrA (membrane-fusion protein)